ncbi:MAG: UDP-4-amino-4,6-dideoxy-N-acetyl-beta-L-altrosamine transaminase [Nitrospinota bacterium]|nr:UDP-4-amino-4,6-dideoxy-N-acetyl-beta-L-altrosamine transaminase [Nitrospinota bacterium]
MKRVPYGRQQISREDIQAVTKVLEGDWLTQGPLIGKFEEEFARYVGAKYAVALSNGTVALHLASICAGLGHGDILWTSPISFVASANAGLYCGADVDFVDIEPGTANMSVSMLEEKLKTAKNNGKLPKVIIPVHFAGQSCDMEKVGALSKEYGFTVIEDACHASGGTYKGEKVGSCGYSSMAVFSFHPVKIITTGEGGMICTNDAEIYKRLLRLRTHGITRDEAFMEGASEGGWYYEMVELGMNCRITDFQCALGLSQLSRIDQFVARRNELASRYDKELQGLPLSHLDKSDDAYSAYHLYVIRLDLEKCGKTRREVYDALIERGVLANVHYIPIHLQPLYRKMGFKKGDFPNAEKYYEEALTIPLYPSMTDNDFEQVVESLREAVA